MIISSLMKKNESMFALLDWANIFNNNLYANTKFDAFFYDQRRLHRKKTCRKSS